ncbi:hypothetical protein L873DRAFT_1803666 [Choiromyces venosus 120613-1]|uniref:Elongator complex protein 6 n=1 Tax=Choiromyces venosus 120613-1 TaxID=1336337 RepID=A0A3N4K6A6_9PEZI|nr:hypothetical protein L873DRAFT_1803666 [Choiromyces venosus 120613-1]
MPPPTPLAPYTSPPPTPHTLTLITSLLPVPSTWLTQHLLSLHLSSSTSSSNPPSTILISLTQDQNFHLDALKKLGIQTQTLQRSTRFTFLGINDIQLDLPALSKTVREALSRASAGEEEVILMLESVDILLSSGAADINGVMDLILYIQETATHTIVSVNADDPLMRNEQHAALVVGLGHIAHRVFALRGLDTGVARDVSGVLRVTGGGGSAEGGKEVLYFVGDGGGVEVFERGEVRS